jgi:hypothetical protein
MRELLALKSDFRNGIKYGILTLLLLIEELPHVSELKHSLRKQPII